jgi:tRNA-2-methylthio-N6-dimethylallyladenosine synthase
MKYFFVVFGCQMNYSDAERMRTVLEKIGYKSASTLEEADLLVVNMCSVRQSAVDRVYGLIPKIRQQKKTNPRFRSLLSGCILQTDRQKLRSEFDFILETQNLAIWPEKLGFPEKNLSVNHYLEIKPTYQSSFTAFVPIMTGCNYQCTYCVVPTTRHQEYYRPAEDILQEIKELAEKNYQEIWLLGQNVNHYHSTLNSQPVNFSRLLELIEKIEGNFWLYFTSPYPSDFDDQSIEVIAQSKKLAPYLNLPLQSGDNEILQKMNRLYTVEEYLELVKKVKKAFQKFRKGLEKHPVISTDVIVGFPGETKKAFQKTVKIFKKSKFEAAHIASFSPRPGTVALKLKNQVTDLEKERRKRKLTEILEKTAFKGNRKYLHQTIPVLIEKADSQKNFLLGRTFSYKTVKVPGLSKKELIGKKIPIEISKVNPWQLEGKISSLP